MVNFEFSFSFLVNDISKDLQNSFLASDGTFHFWETNTWTSEPWSSSNGYVSVSNIFTRQSKIPAFVKYDIVFLHCNSIFLLLSLRWSTIAQCSLMKK